MKIYTKTGDDGTTGLFGGIRVPKHSMRIEAYGTVDELNAVLGMVLTHEMPEVMRDELTMISSDLFTLGSDLATPLNPPPTYPIPRITEEHVAILERRIDAYDVALPALKQFILPGGTPAAAGLHLARTVCRRAERRAVVLAEHEEISEYVIRFLNRLSDYLFTAARAANQAANVPDVPWRSTT